MRLGVLVLALAAAALAGVPFVGAKEGARARLGTALPTQAAPGTTVEVRWTVTFPGNNGGRAFNAIGMFVQLLSRSGSPATMGFASATAHPDGRYRASVRVPAGGRGGIQFGLRGSTDIFFPLENDPFASPAGVRCDVTAVSSTLAAFVRAYNRGDIPQLEKLFARERFVWYSSGAPGRRLLPAAGSRDTLGAYFLERHRRGDLLRLETYRFNGYEPRRELGHFELTARRRANGYRGGRWFDVGAKGAVDCAAPPVSIAVLSIGGALR
jgi:hypothetical protein